MNVCKLFLALPIAFVVACTNSDVEVDNDKTAKVVVNEKNLSLEERASRHITGSLAIPATEKFTMEIKKGHLNADNDEDAIITINRLDFAKEELLQKRNPEYIKQLGYNGNYNYFVYYDGEKDKFSVPIPVPSSALAPLKVKFENIYSDIYYTLTIEYRVMEGSFKNFYFIERGILQKVFQTKIYDYIGTDKPEVFFIEYVDGSESAAKDLMVYEGVIKDYAAENIKDIYDFNPTIEKKKNAKLILKWFYSPKDQAYMTPGNTPRQ